MLEFTWDIRQDLVAGALDYLRDAVRTAGEEGRRARVSLSGGSTPRALFAYLGEHPEALPSERLSVWWGDERPVPYTSDESNFGVASRLWISRWPTFAGDVHPWRTDVDPAVAARLYGEELQSAFPGEKPPAFDLIFLGIGPEGHTASLFPDSAILTSTEWTAAPYVATKETARLTLTLPVLNHARRVVFMVNGEEKRDILT
ncbi:MAG: 6-phosphogluconolactonase, partial [Clostridia bacterium]